MPAQFNKQGRANRRYPRRISATPIGALFREFGSVSASPSADGSVGFRYFECVSVVKYPRSPSVIFNTRGITVILRSTAAITTCTVADFLHYIYLPSRMDNVTTMHLGTLVMTIVFNGLRSQIWHMPITRFVLAGIGNGWFLTGKWGVRFRKKLFERCNAWSGPEKARLRVEQLVR